MAHTAYSYRMNPAVPAFDDSTPLIIFDGHCVLCSSGVSFMLKRDPNGTSRFAAIQSPLPRALYAHYGLDAERFDTFMVLRDGIAHLKWRGVLTASESMGGFWLALAFVGKIVPTRLGDWLYDIVQRNRIRWFGSRESCFLPEKQQRQRFLT